MKKTICFLSMLVLLFPLISLSDGTTETPPPEAIEEAIEKVRLDQKYGLTDGVYRIEGDFLLYEKEGALTCICLKAEETLRIPDGVERLDYEFTHYTDVRAVERVILPDGLKTIEGGALESICYSEIRLPASLGFVGDSAFWNADLDMLILPKNMHFGAELSSECLTLFAYLKTDTLVITNTEQMIPPYELQQIGFPMDGSGRLVFWGKPPSHITVSDLYFLYRNEETPFRFDIGPFTICYPREFAKYWAPNGETRWNSLPIRALTAAEEREIMDAAPHIFASEASTDPAGYPGWRYDTQYNVDIFTEAGWSHYQEYFWIKQAAELRLHEGIERAPYDMAFSKEVWQEGTIYELYADRLILPSTLKSIDLFHLYVNKIEVAEGNPYLKMIDGKLYSSGGQLLWSPPDAPHPTPDLGTPLTEAEIAARLAQAEAYRQAQAAPSPTATPAPTPTATPAPTPSPTAEPVVAEETTDLRIPLLIGAIAIVAAAAVVVKRHP